MSNVEQKIKIIDAICTRHPAYGVEKGWSEYVGGMRDTGQWFFRKMLDCSEEELQSFLDNIIVEENIPPYVLTEQEEADSKIIHYLPDGSWINEYERQKMEKFNDELELKMIFGNTDHEQ